MSTPLHTAFQNAHTAYLVRKEQGIDARKPKMHFPDFVVTRASDNSKNPGFLYVKSTDAYPNDKYLGKIHPLGIFTPSFDCNLDAGALETITVACNAPLELTQEVGRETGTCCCCGRTLTNPLSVKLGIGPICRDGWFPDAQLISPDIPGVNLIDLTDLADLGETPILDQVVAGLAEEPVADLENFYDVPELPTTEPQVIFVAVDQLLEQYRDLSTSDRIVFLSRVALMEIAS